MIDQKIAGAPMGTVDDAQQAGKVSWVTLAPEFREEALNLPDGTCVRIVDRQGLFWGQFQVGTNWVGERITVRCTDRGETY